MKRVVAVLLALLFAYWGQRFFANDAPILDALILYGIAALFLSRVPPRVEAPTLSPSKGADDERTANPGSRSETLQRGEEAVSRPKTWLWNWLRSRGGQQVTKGLILLIALGLALVGYASWILAQQGRSNEALVLWIVGLLCFIFGFWRTSPVIAIRMRWRELAVLAAIMLVALFMRAYRLDQIPPAAYLDEADNGIWGLRFVSEPFSPFTPSRDSNTTLFYQVLGLSLKTLGVRVLTMRCQDVVVGLLTVLAFYFLARDLYGVPAAQGAAFLLAVSRWHTNFSRIAFVEIAPVPLFEILVVLFLWRGMERGRRSDFAWAGLFFGLGFHTYIGYRVFPAVIGLLVVHQLVVDRTLAWPGRQWLNLIVFGLATFMTLAPLGVYALKHPDIFMSRVEAASVAQDVERAGSYEPVWINLKKSLLMFNHKGDPRPRHNLPHEPMLDFGTAILFGLGVGYSLRYFRHSRYFLPLVWVLIGLLPSVLSLADSNPHSSRTLGNIGPVFLLIAATWDRLRFALLEGLKGKGYRLLVGAAVVGLLLIGRSNYQTFFYKQAQAESVYYDFDPIQTSVGEAIKANGHDYRVFVSSEFANHSAVKFIPYNVPYQVFDLNVHLPIREQVDRDVLFILERNHAPFVTRLQRLYPRGTYREVEDRYARLMYYTFLVPKEEIAATQGLWGRYYEGMEATGQPALERQDATLSFRWTPPPLDLPFSAQWEGSLYVPRYGTYAFILDSSGSAQLSIDDKSLVESRGGRAQATKLLPAGFHSIAVSCVEEGEGGSLKLSWITPGGQEEVIPQNALYAQQLSRFGLLGRYYPGAENWAGQPAVVQIDPFIAPNDVLHAPFSIEWEGKLYAPTTGRYLFATNSDDGSFLYVNGQLVVDNGGHHGDRYVEGWIDLQQGFQDIWIRYFQDDGGRKIELWWMPPGGSKEQVPAEQLIPPDAPLIKPPPVPTPIPRATPVPVAAALGEVHFVTQWGGRGSEEGLFVEPRGVAVDQRGYVYVADTGNKRVQKFDTQGGFIAVWLGGEGVFAAPFDLVVSSRGDVYVLDAGRQAVLRFSSEGEFLGQIGTDLGLYGPRGLGIDAGDNLYVANTGGSCILKLSTSGQLLAQYGTPGGGPGQLSQPTDVAVDGGGRLYVVDTLNRRMQVLAPTGDYLAEWVITGANTTDSPHIALGPSGEVYLSEPEGHRVLVYDGQGQLLGQFGGEGVGSGQFNKPIGVAVDAQSRVYVADVYNHRVQKFEVMR